MVLPAFFRSTSKFSSSSARLFFMCLIIYSLTYFLSTITHILLSLKEYSLVFAIVMGNLFIWSSFWWLRSLSHHKNFKFAGFFLLSFYEENFMHLLLTFQNMISHLVHFCHLSLWFNCPFHQGYS